MTKTAIITASSSSNADHTNRPAKPPTPAAKTPHEVPHREPKGISPAAIAWLEEPADADLEENDITDNTFEPAPFPPSVSGHVVMEHTAITAALRASGYDGSFDHLSSGEEQRVRTLLQYRTADLFRPHLIGTPAMLTRLDALDRAQANFSAVTQLVRRAVTLSLLAGCPLPIPPVLMVGSPGIGKSRYARALADAIGTDLSIINGSTIPDVGSLTGYPPVWRGAGPGRIAKMLVSATTTSPMILVDEAEKIADFEHMAAPLDRLLSLLEPSTARAYQDECLQVPMRADGAIVLFACNDLTRFSAPFLDRVVVVRIPDLDRDQREAVLDAMLAEVTAEIGIAISLASRAVLAPLHDVSLRRCRLALSIAVGHAVTEQRRFITRGDLAAAVALLGRQACREPIGFIRPRD